jgi:amino acid permease
LFYDLVSLSFNLNRIAGYLGKNWGMFLGALYFVMLVIWVFVYSTAITNDSASFSLYSNWMDSLKIKTAFLQRAV